MKKLLILLFVVLFSGSAFSQFSFYLMDNFEDGNYTKSPKWWSFGALKAEVTGNPSQEGRDLIAESCGDYSLRLRGQSTQWYVGGVGTDIGVDASGYARFQIDIYGDTEHPGKLKIELFDDDNLNYSIEQDPLNNYAPINDDKWVAEVSVQGKGFTRTSIPFMAFVDDNPGVGDDIWNPNQEEGSGGLLKIQLVAITEEKQGEMDFSIDNLLLTY